ncbi:MAG: MBL fold metallo-hydrolase [Planctomycetota bacterium]
MKSTRVPSLFHWNVYQPERRIDFNSFFWASESGGVLIDPMPASAATEEFVLAQGGATSVVLTNADHLRATERWKELTGARVFAPRAESSALSKHEGLVDDWFEQDGQLPAPIGASIQAFPLRGGKSPGEVALYIPSLRALVFGDAVRSHDSGAFRLLPDGKITDRAQLARDVRGLRDLNAEVYLLGDGDSFFWAGRSAFLNFLRDLSD